MTVEKQLANAAEFFRQIHADRWALGLTNGHSLAVTAQRADGFLLLSAETGCVPSDEILDELSAASAAMPTGVKFAWRRSWPALRLRAEFPLPAEEVDDGRVRRHLDGMRRTYGQLRDGLFCEEPGVAEASPGAGAGLDAPGDLPDWLREAGWACHQRPGASLLADLETNGYFQQAEIAAVGGCTRFRATLYRADNPPEPCVRALAWYLLEANADLRLARGFLERDAGGLAAGFDVGIAGELTPADAEHALAALSVACRSCARQMDVLQDDALAGLYRSARGLNLTKGA
jgi:hypothetical protein